MFNPTSFADDVVPTPQIRRNTYESLQKSTSTTMINIIHWSGHSPKTTNTKYENKNKNREKKTHKIHNNEATNGVFDVGDVILTTLRAHCGGNVVSVALIFGNHTTFNALSGDSDAKK